MQPARLGVATGSSPRIRGECNDLAIHHVDVGIIPANTGRIDVFEGVGGVHWDHPREYGENLPPR